jgi:hypothetical protein
LAFLLLVHGPATVRAQQRHGGSGRLLFNHGCRQFFAKLLAQFQHFIFNGRQIRRVGFICPIQQRINQALGFDLQFGFHFGTCFRHGGSPGPGAASLPIFAPSLKCAPGGANG